MKKRQDRMAKRLMNLTERLAVCPGCGYMETLLFDKKHLLPQGRFSEMNGNIYHQCRMHGGRPCKLF